VNPFAPDINCLWFPPDANAPPPPDGTPAVLFLHGVGERGNGYGELSKVADWGLPKFRAEGRPLSQDPFPFAVIAPQCPPDKTWCDDEVLDALDRLLVGIKAKDDIDNSRLHLSGFSMGGIGAFCFALRRPACFASMSAVCGRCLTPDALPSLARLPIWIAYAEDDEITELAQGSKIAAQRLVRYGNLIDHRYRLGHHGDLGPHIRTCDAAYAEPELYRWLGARRLRPNLQAGNSGHEC